MVVVPMKKTEEVRTDDDTKQERPTSFTDIQLD